MVRNNEGRRVDMALTSSRPKLAIVSPFLDKRHGTERRVVEWIAHLSAAFEVHIYSQRVEDVDLSSATWHRIPRLPGPHLFNFIWWFAANRIWRSFHRHFRRLRYDVVFSPGVNCLDADAVSVHIVFGEYLDQVSSKLRFRESDISTWPQIAHRKLYYKLLIALERQVFTNSRTTLILIARKTGDEITRHYAREGPFPVMYLGIDHATFNPSRRKTIRAEARKSLGISPDRFVVLLIGNDWRNKGVPVLLEALSRIIDLPVDLLVVSNEHSNECESLVETYALKGRVQIQAPRREVEQFYAAADSYAGPSLEDTFALPPAEAMACGLPVIVSSTNGTSEIIRDERDGLILPDARDAGTLSSMIRRLVEDPDFREHLGRNASETALQFSWESNGRDLSRIFGEIFAKKLRPQEDSLAAQVRNQ